MSNIVDDFMDYPCYTDIVKEWERPLQRNLQWLFSWRKLGERMPRRPKHPCSHPGCPNLTDRRFCEEHEKLANQNYEKYERNKSNKRRYGRVWKRIRDKYVSMHPFCEVCYERGILVETEEVHHKKPLSEGGTHERDNLIALCKSCHSRIHAERGDRFHTNRGYSY